jgi:hypothetical protein
MRTQGELIVLVAPKKAAAKSKSAAEAESEELGTEDAVPTPLDLSKMSDEELKRILAEDETGPVVKLPRT